MTSPNFYAPTVASSSVACRTSHFLPTKRFVRSTLGLLLLSCLILPVYSAHAKALRRAEIEARATKYCRAIFHTCDTVQVERREWYEWAGDAWIKHRHWQAKCTADKESAVLQMEEGNFHLTAVFNENHVLPLDHKHVSSSSGLALKNPAQAREASLIQLRDLDFFRSGHDYTISASPTPVFNGRAWQLIWQERDRNTHESRYLTVLLDAKSKVLLMVFEPLRRENVEGYRRTP